MSFFRGQKVREKKTGQIYDFGYWGQMGHAICYEEGECNMQDSVAFDKDDIEPAE
jgi:hypothetical protein